LTRLFTRTGGHLVRNALPAAFKIAVNAHGCNEAHQPFFVIESSPNDPETVSAAPHRAALSPYAEMHTEPRISAI
jgi:hypothetical protein